jgi:hypothetical protein
MSSSDQPEPRLTPGGVQEEPEAVSDKRDLRSKQTLLTVLRRAGIPEDTLEALSVSLQDPVDLRRDANLLTRHGVTLDRLVDGMGGSP